jgi:hypothetical protein
MPSRTLATYLQRLPQHLARELSNSASPDAPLAINVYQGVSNHPAPAPLTSASGQEADASKRKRPRNVGATDRERFTHPAKPLTPQQKTAAGMATRSMMVPVQISTGDKVDGSYSAWDYNNEGDWFSPLLLPPCGLPQTMYEKCVTAFVRSLKGNTPVYATPVIKQVLVQAHVQYLTRHSHRSWTNAPAHNKWQRLS